MTKRIYLDYAATTPLDPEVLQAMTPYFSEKFGNPGSLHSFGQEAIAAVDLARESIAKAVGASVAEGFREIIFTGSATEANNLALRGSVANFRKTNPATPPRLIISAIEHESVLETARALEREGLAELVVVPVNSGGIIDVKNIKGSLTKNTALVSVMYANNEIGAIQPIKEIAAAIKEFKKENAVPENGAPFLHTDAVQAFQFLDCDVQGLGVDMMTLSSHKLYGPKGIGMLWSSVRLEPIVFGGGQEFGLRSGTENVPSIVGFAKAVELAVQARAAESKRIAELREALWASIKKIFPTAELNGAPGDAEPSQTALPNILNIYFPGREAQDLLTKFDLRGLAASAGSACHSRAFTSSYVITALGHSKERAASSVRFSIGRPTRPEDIAAALEIMAD